MLEPFRKFSCDICNKKLSRAHLLKVHMHTHLGIKPYKCPHCNYASAHCYAVTIHKRIHSKSKPYTCQECKTSFTTQSRWKAHGRIHSGERLYKCSHCTHTFIRRDGLRRHENMHETQKKFSIVCVMQDFGTQLWTEGNGCPCTIRTKTQLDMDYHIQRNHTMEGLGKKLQSETRLADFFRSKNQDFDRDWVNQINFKYCKNIEGNACSARPDFFLLSQSIRLKCILLIGNDELGHRRYPCDFQRIFNIANALEQNPDFQGLPLLYIRFNPHFFKRDGIYFDPPLSSSHEKLLQLIESLNPSDIKPGVNLIYMNYDTTNNQLDIFHEDPENDFAKLYQSCVLKHM